MLAFGYKFSNKKQIIKDFALISSMKRVQKYIDFKHIRSSHMPLTGGPPSQSSTIPRPIKFPCTNNQENHQAVMFTSQALQPDHEKLSSSIGSKMNTYERFVV